MSRGTGWLLTLGVWFVLGGALVLGASGLQRRSAYPSGQDRPGRTQADRLGRTASRAATAASTSGSADLQCEKRLCVAHDQEPFELTDRELAALEDLMDSEPCTPCGGTGRDIDELEGECLHCGGEGWTSRA